MDRELPVAAAEVRPAEDLVNLKAAINGEHAAGMADIGKGAEHYRRAGDYLIRAKEECKKTGKWFERWMKKELTFTPTRARQYMRIARNWDSQKTEIISAFQEPRFPDGDEVDADDEAAVEKPAEDVPFVTLERWKAFKPAERQRLLTLPVPNVPASDEDLFNSQGDAEGIHWARWSWNPVTGCRHDCPYCYARDIANRLFESKFEPSFWPRRLHGPRNTPFPAEKVADNVAFKNVFVCSMADLFGRWVPKEWIEAVLSVCAAAPQWHFLFLTKFPIRLAEFTFSENCWVGTTVDCQARVPNAEKAFRKVKAAVKWLSCEPLIEPLEFQDLGAFQWMVFGGASASTRTPEWQPPLEWVVRLQQAAEAAGCEVYFKPNLIRRQSFPWDKAPPRVMEAPAALRYLAQVEK
jgi:protein gp37